MPGQVWAAGFEGGSRGGIPIKASNPGLLELSRETDGSIYGFVGRVVGFVLLDGDKVQEGALWRLPLFALLLLVLLVLLVGGHPLGTLLLSLSSLEL